MNAGYSIFLHKETLTGHTSLQFGEYNSGFLKWICEKTFHTFHLPARLSTRRLFRRKILAVQKHQKDPKSVGYLQLQCMKAFVRVSEGTEMTLSELLDCARKHSVNSGIFIISSSHSEFFMETQFVLGTGVRQGNRSQRS